MSVNYCHAVLLHALSNANCSKLSGVESDTKFRTFWPSVKIRERWANSLYQLLKLYLRTNLRNTSYLAPFPRYSLGNVQNSYIFLPLFGLTPRRRGSPGTISVKFLPGCRQVTNVLNGAETLPKISIAWVGCTNVTDDRRQTDARRHIANANVSSRSLKCRLFTNWW